MTYFDSIASNDRPAEPATQPFRWPQPGELRSLWDMKDWDGGGLASALHTLSTFNQVVHSQRLTSEDFSFVESNRRQLLHQTKFVAEMADRHDFDVLRLAADDFASELMRHEQLMPTDVISLGRGQVTQLYSRLDCLTRTIEHTLQARKILVLSLSAQRLYEAREPLFGDKVFDRFPVAIDDVVESGKCLALERGTATVFHLMRVMEAGLKALGKELGIPYAPSWESYIVQLDKLLDGKSHASLTPEQKAKRPFYQDVLGDLISIKSAWRNPTMHIVRSYDVQQAMVVFEAVKLLMQHLAKELSADPSTVISTGQSS